jgi:hypothetical protein
MQPGSSMVRTSAEVCTLALFLAAASAQQTERVLVLKESPTALTVDGVIEPAWSVADSATGFFQLTPYFAQPPKYSTVAKLLTTPEALHCLMICQQPPGEIEAQTGVLDQFSGDVVSLMIDTFGDKQTAYKFAVSSSGVRSDARMLDDARNRDYSWDGVWFAASKLYEWGFVVEMKIPYRTIRYDGTLKEWGLDFDRWIPATREDLYWCSCAQNEGQRISRFGRLILNGARPTVHGLNLEVYPVGIAKATYLQDGKYRVEPEAGIDLFYNPSEKLTFQLTGNPDFAQIEADPYEFNISRYETYFDERRPFFTEGNEIFMASGRQRNTGFYRPMELFYSRRIGRALSDGTLVPLVVGTKASGRAGDWQYGGFYALTGEEEYMDDGAAQREEQAHFVAARLKRQILENSSVGVLFVGKAVPGNLAGVLDLDGAFRTSTLQISYQIARSIDNGQGDFALSAGLTSFGPHWWNAARIRAIGKEFDVDAVGFVPWRGTAQLTALTGPAWYFDDGAVRQCALYFGLSLNYEDADLYTDRVGVLGFNINFRSDWGMEVSLEAGRSRDLAKEYPGWEVDYSWWYNTSPRWSGNIWGSVGKMYNFSRDYLAHFGYCEGEFSWKPASVLGVGTSVGVFVEGNPEGSVEEITYNARPYVSLTPVNDLNIRFYVDNIYLGSSERLEHLLYGLLVSYNFLPKSWVYLALNEMQERRDILGPMGTVTARPLETASRAGVVKIKYLYYL